MVKKYAHMDSGTLAQFANVVTFWAHDAEKAHAAFSYSSD